MRNSRFAAPDMGSHASRFVLLLKGIVLTAVLIAFVLLMQVTWSVAKSAWPLQSQDTAPALTNSTPINLERTAPMNGVETDRI